MRVCVEIDLTRPLVGDIMLDGHWQRVEYRGLHVVCMKGSIWCVTTVVAMAMLRTPAQLRLIN